MKLPRPKVKEGFFDIDAAAKQYYPNPEPMRNDRTNSSMEVYTATKLRRSGVRSIATIKMHP